MNNNHYTIPEAITTSTNSPLNSFSKNQERANLLRQNKTNLPPNIADSVAMFKLHPGLDYKTKYLNVFDSIRGDRNNEVTCPACNPNSNLKPLKFRSGLNLADHFMIDHKEEINILLEQEESSYRINRIRNTEEYKTTSHWLGHWILSGGYKELLEVSNKLSSAQDNKSQEILLNSSIKSSNYPSASSVPSQIDLFSNQPETTELSKELISETMKLNQSNNKKIPALPKRDSNGKFIKKETNSSKDQTPTGAIFKNLMEKELFVEAMEVKSKNSNIRSSNSFNTSEGFSPYANSVKSLINPSFQSPFKELCDIVRNSDEINKKWRGKTWDSFVEIFHGIPPCLHCHKSEANTIHHQHPLFHEIVLIQLKKLNTTAEQILAPSSKKGEKEKRIKSIIKEVYDFHMKLGRVLAAPYCTNCNVHAEQVREKFNK